MQLPNAVRRAIEERADVVGFPALKRAAVALSAEYREGYAARVGTPDRLASYLVTRMPATYSAAYFVLEELRGRLGAVAGILDVGAGSGAASLAASQLFPEASITMIERDPAMSGAARDWLPDAHIVTADATQMLALPPHDLVIASYSVGEFSAHIVDRLWQAARKALVVIEPGTPRGFATIRGVRDELLRAGAHMAAPCPTESPCPMVDPDWCHFAARVERSSLHRRLKEGELGYEDEKFSYVAVTREPVAMAHSRIIRRPLYQPGLIVLETCTPEGLRTERVTKRDKDRYRQARKSGWGSALEEEKKPR